VKNASIYEELNVLLDEQLSHTARFIRMAFHVHSPGSFDWADRPHADKMTNAHASLTGDAGVARYLDEVAQELDIACVTDHMKTSYACQAAKAALKRGDVAVFPGIEINVQGGQLGDSAIHVLAIFPPECDTTAIDRIFGKPRGGGRFKSEAERDGNEAYDPESLAELASAIRGQGGLFVLAHVDEAKRGHRARFRALREATLGSEWVKNQSSAPSDLQEQVSKEYLAYVAELLPDAIEIMNPGDQQHYVSIPTGAGARRIPCVIRSDHHCFEDVRRDEWTTWVKVSRSDFTCVRDALQFSETRVRFKNDLPETPCPRIVGVRIQSPGNEGLFRDALIAFNPNLSCLIGPRGAGKSTVIEALRYVLSRTDELQATGVSVGGQINFSNVALEIQRANLDGTLIELIYEVTDGTRYCLRATYDPQSDSTTAVYGLDGSPQSMSPEAIQNEFPVRLYSWSEIEMLGREPQLQRTLLDRLVPDLAPKLEARADLFRSLTKNRSEIDNVVQELDALLVADGSLLRRYVEYKTQFEQINTEEVAQLFSGLDTARSRVSALVDVRDGLAELRETLDGVETLTVEELVTASLASQSEDVRSWWANTVAPSLALEQFSKSINQLVTQARTQVDAKLRDLELRIVEEQKDVAKLEADLRPRTQADASDEVVRDRREERRQRFDRASARREGYLATHQRFTTLLEQRRAVVKELETTQDQISKLRSRSRDSLLAKLSPDQTELDIVINLAVLADRDAAVRYMRDGNFLTMQPFGHYKESLFAERACRMARPTEIARAILDQDQSALEAGSLKLGDKSVLTTEDASRLLEHFNPFAVDGHADVSTVNRAALSAVLRLEEQAVDDEMRILLEGEPVDKCSPGQRSSAMLALVALSETAPLIIDQPEDNLDNRMVGKTLTKILADLKERRQIIVTTHNPNIVVGGDAEQVVVLEPEGADNAKVEKTGSIDDQEIINRVIAIMEGGKEAFEARRRRYLSAYSA
jgi:ABC-type Mn2+/Zn2+ transport system ATPase subunit